MKTLLHILSGFALALAVIVVGAWLIHAGMYADVWTQSLEWIAANRLLALSGAWFFWWLVILFVMTGLRGKPRESMVCISTETGTISVSTRALEEYLSRAQKEFAAVVELKPTVEASGAQMRITLDVKIRAGTQIPELCKMLHERVKQVVQAELGLSAPTDVRVHVKQIIVPASETQAGTVSADSEGWVGGGNFV